MLNFNKYIELNKTLNKKNRIKDKKENMNILEHVSNKLKKSIFFSLILFVTSSIFLLNSNEIILSMLNIKTDITNIIDLTEMIDSQVEFGKKIYLIIPTILYLLSHLFFVFYYKYALIKNKQNFHKHEPEIMDSFFIMINLILVLFFCLFSFLTTFTTFASFVFVLFMSFCVILENFYSQHKIKNTIKLLKNELKNVDVNEIENSIDDIKNEMNKTKMVILNNHKEMKIIAEEATNINPDYSYKKDIAISIMKEFEEINKAKQALNEFNQKIDNVFNYEKRNSQIINE